VTLQQRLLITIGLSFTLLWTTASVWMLVDVRTEFRNALDERLAASARMVAGLLTQLPQGSNSEATIAPNIFDVAGRDGVACEISLLRGDVVARTHNSPPTLTFAPGGYTTRTIADVRWRSYTLQQGGIRVTTADRVDRREVLLEDIVIAAAVPFLIAMAGSLVALWFGVRRGLAPLESIRAALSERKPEALMPLPTLRIPAELSPLVFTINRLLGRMHRAMERERSFTGNAAHELRTPLTAVKTHIQVARRSDGSDLASALSNAEKGVLRLQRTLDQLLMLSRVEGAFSFGAEEGMAAFKVARQAIEEIAVQERQRIHLEGDDTPIQVKVPSVLAIAALRNLFDNALRCSPPGSRVTVRIKRDGDVVAFLIADQGRGMSDEDQHRAVQRFWRQGRGEGSGLGLSIVDAIVQRYGGQFSLRRGEPCGTVAEIRFPVE
jgi:two-component system sensor histidine kinase QseC